MAEMKKPKQAVSEAEASKYIESQKEASEYETTRRLATERAEKIKGRDAGEIGTKWEDLFKKK